jgi:hypothetical protein
VHTSAVSREEVSTVQVGSPVKSRKNGVLQKQKSEDVCDSKRMGHYPREEPSKKGKTSFRIPKLSRRTSTDSSSSTGSKESVRTRAFSVDLSQESSDERTHNVKEKTLSSLTVKKRDRLYNANVKRRRIYPKSSESDDDASGGSVLALFQSKPKVQSRSKTDVGCGRRSPGFPKGRSSSSKDSINSSQHSPSRSLCVSPVSSGPSSPTVQPSASPLPLQGTSITKTSPSALVICSSPESAPLSPDLPTSDCPVTAMQSSSPYKSTPLSTIDTAASKSYTAVPSPSRPKIVTPVVLSAGQTVPKAPEDDPVSNKLNPPESPFSPSSVIPLSENDNCSQFVVELKMESQLTDDSSDKVCKSPAPNELEVVKNKENKTDKVICIDTSNLTDGGDKQAESSHDEDEEQGCHHKNMDGKQCKRIVLEGKRVCDIHHKEIVKLQEALGLISTFREQGPPGESLTKRPPSTPAMEKLSGKERHVCEDINRGGLESSGGQSFCPLKIDLTSVSADMPVLPDKETSDVQTSLDPNKGSSSLAREVKSQLSVKEMNTVLSEEVTSLPVEEMTTTIPPSESTGGASMLTASSPDSKQLMRDMPGVEGMVTDPQLQDEYLEQVDNKSSNRQPSEIDILNIKEQQLMNRLVELRKSRNEVEQEMESLRHKYNNLSSEIQQATKEWEDALCRKKQLILGDPSRPPSTASGSETQDAHTTVSHSPIALVPPQVPISSDAVVTKANITVHPNSLPVSQTSSIKPMGRLYPAQHKSEVCFMKYMEGYLVSASKDGIYHVHNSVLHSFMYSYKTSISNVAACDMSHNTIVFASYDGHLCIVPWKFSNPEPLYARASTDIVCVKCVGSCLAVGLTDGRVQVFSLKTGVVQYTVRCYDASSGTSIVSLEASLKHFVVGSSDLYRPIICWRIEDFFSPSGSAPNYQNNFSVACPFQKSPFFISSMHLTLDDILFISLTDGSLLVQDLSKQMLLKFIKLSPYPLSSLYYSHRFIFANNAPGDLCLCNLETCKLQGVYKLYSPVSSLSVHGNKLYYGLQSGQVIELPLSSL